MERDVLLAIRELLESSRVLAVAVIVDGDPEAALLPYALRADYGAAYVQASALARAERAPRLAERPSRHAEILFIKARGNN